MGKTGSEDGEEAIKEVTRWFLYHFRSHSNSQFKCTVRIRKVDVFDGGPLKLNVDTSILSAEQVVELRRKAAAEARRIRWNKIIDRIPKGMRRKRAFLDRVRDGHLSENEGYQEEPTQRPARETRLDVLVMAKIAEIQQARAAEAQRKVESTSSSETDEASDRKRKVPQPRHMEVTPTKGVTQPL